MPMGVKRVRKKTKIFCSGAIQFDDQSYMRKVKKKSEVFVMPARNVIKVIRKLMIDSIIIY